MVKIGQLIIVGGPSCAGKSTLMREIHEGACPDLCNKIDMTAPSSWYYTSAIDLVKLREPMMERVIVHYDIFSHYFSKKKIGYISELINNSESVIVLTLYAPLRTFVRRVELRICKELMELFTGCLVQGCAVFWTLRSAKDVREVLRSAKKSLRKVKWLLRVYKAYRRGYSVFLYKKWFRNFDNKDVKTHLVLDSSRPGFPSIDFCKRDYRDSLKSLVTNSQYSI